MATIYKMDEHLSIADKWDICKNYYNKMKYQDANGKRIFLDKRPSDKEVEDLYQKIGRFNMNVSLHFQKKPGLVDNFMNHSGLIPSDEPEIE